MKIAKLLLASFLAVIICKNAIAFDPVSGCQQILKQAMIQGKINDYKNKGTLLEDGTYVLCFDQTGNASESSVTITVNPHDPIIIYGLKLNASDTLTGPLLTLSGSSITLQNLTLTGNGQGTAILVSAGGEGVVIQDSTIFKFADGIKADAGASVKLTNNIYAGIEAGKIFTTADAVSPIDVNKLGRYMSEEDANKVDYVAGRLELETCSGQVEKYKVQTDDIKFPATFYLATHPAANCEVQADLKVQFKDEEEQTFACGFKCDNFLEDLSTQVVFAYTSADSITYPFAPIPFKSFNDLPEVISVMSTFTQQETGNDMNGGGGTIIEVPGFGGTNFNGPMGDCESDDCALLDPTILPDSKTKSQAGAGSSGDEKINQSGVSGGCGKASIADADVALNIASIVCFFAIAAGVPAASAIRRRIGK